MPQFARPTVVIWTFLAAILYGLHIEAAADRDPFRPPAIASEHVPSIPPVLIERLRQYQSVRTAGFRGWSPDGQGILIQTRFGDTAQLHRVYTPGGRREQITFLLEPANGTFIPRAGDGALLLNLSQGGNENDQIFLLDRSDGKPRLLTDGKSRNLLEALQPDGRRLIVGSNRRNGRDTDLYIGNPREPGSLKLLLEVDRETWSARDWSQDGNSLLLNHYVSANESYPALFDVAAGTRTMIPIPGRQTAAYGSLAFAPDGRFAYVTTDAQSEFQQLARVDLKSFEHEFLTQDIPWDIETVVVDAATGRVAFAANVDGASQVYLLKDNQRQRVDLPLGIVTGLEFSPDSARLGFTLARPDAPADAYSVDVATGGLTRWTFSEVGGLNAANFIVPRVIRFPSFDGRQIPAFYSTPRVASPTQRVPVIISIHGGPESQTQPFFSAIDQFYLNELGMAVLKPNVRGSSGYGKEYLKLDNAAQREDSVRDIGALLDWIAAQPELDPDRVAVIGGSYGGYMVLSSLAHYSDRIKAGVDIVGIASFNSFLKNTSPYRQDLRRVEYGDERDPAMQAVFAKIDPVNIAQQIRSALLVAHGRNDPRVPFSEAEQIVAKVRADGREVWTIYADNEGHGFAKKANADYLSASIVLFFQHHLGERRGVRD